VTRWLWPESADEAVALRAEHGEEALPVAGGTFLGVLLQCELIEPPETFLALGRAADLRGIAVEGDELVLGATTTHAEVERSSDVRAGWPALADCFGQVANVRVRSVATVGGVLADADYASDPPAMLLALGARAALRSPRGERLLGIDELIVGHYTTALEPDELLVSVRVPRVERAAYVKFRSRSAEDRPCVGVAAARLAGGATRIAVGAVSDRPRLLEELDGVDLIDDLRGSASYRRRMVDVHTRRALELLDG
jgi:carbon-monoxide dehydrogenase medium subunit